MLYVSLLIHQVYHVEDGFTTLTVLRKVQALYFYHADVNVDIKLCDSLATKTYNNVLDCCCSILVLLKILPNYYFKFLKHPALFPKASNYEIG